MKPGWETNTLGNVLAVIKNGVNCKQDKSGDGNEISRIESISNATFDIAKVGYAQLSEREKEKNLLQRGDILFSHINSAVHVGKTAVFDCDEPVYHGVNLLLMRPKVIVNPDFLNHALKHLFQTGYWRTVCKQSVNQASVNQQDICRVEIHYPKSLAEQQRIVGILDEAFEGIATAKANAEKNRQNSRDLFESYLQCVFDDRGAEWKQETMVDVCSIITCGVASTPKYVDEQIGIPFLSAQNVKDGEVVLERYRFISREFHEKLTKKNKPRNSDILYSRVGAKYGEAAVVEHDFEFSIYVSLTLIRPRPEKLNSHFLMYYLNSPVGKALAKRCIASSGVPNLNVNDVRKFPVGYPSMKQQLRIVDQLQSLNAEIQRLATIYERKLAALDELKKSLLHQAFSGEL